MNKIEAELKDILQIERPRPVSLDRERTCVYIVRNLKKREIFYIGVSCDPYARMQGHYDKAKKPRHRPDQDIGSDWAKDNCSIEIIWYSNRADAEISEELLINMLKPKYNAYKYWNDEVLYAEEA
jgi:predicted GIY-YIG superfamily endonuclease